MTREHLFSENLALIDLVIAGVCRRARIAPQDAEDFASVVRIALMENDCAILARYAGRSSLSTYLTIVVQRLLLNERDRTMGRWRPSAEAQRAGAAGVMLETLVCRNGRSLDEALPIVAGAHPEITRAEAEAILARLPPRSGRPRQSDLSAIDPVAEATADGALLDREAQALARKTTEVIQATLDSFSLEDRMILRLRFGAEMGVADVSRMMRLPQRPLYRRIDALLAKLRRALLSAGIRAETVEDVIGRACVDMDFGLSAGKSDDARRSNGVRPA